jgi:cell fate regulator YaaT (PSP1 superfamily)
MPMVLQAATQQEIDAIAQNEIDAETSVATAIVAARRLRLPMQIIGAVYQHDRQKLTFMYEATERVDFRQLLRDLYSDYRCRIWMEVPVGSINPLTRSPSPELA